MGTRAAQLPLAICSSRCANLALASMKRTSFRLLSLFFALAMAFALALLLPRALPLLLLRLPISSASASSSSSTSFCTPLLSFLLSPVPVFLLANLIVLALFFSPSSSSPPPLLLPLDQPSQSFTTLSDFLDPFLPQETPLPPDHVALSLPLTPTQPCIPPQTPTPESQGLLRPSVIPEVPRKVSKEKHDRKQRSNEPPPQPLQTQLAVAATPEPQLKLLQSDSCETHSTSAQQQARTEPPPKEDIRKLQLKLPQSDPASDKHSTSTEPQAVKEPGQEVVASSGRTMSRSKSHHVISETAPTSRKAMRRSATVKGSAMVRRGDCPDKPSSIIVMDALPIDNLSDDDVNKVFADFIAKKLANMKKESLECTK